MKCPVDNVELLMTTRSGVEIDYCPQCRGIWLDRGELDKLIERAEEAMTDRRPQAPVQPYAQQPPIRVYEDDDDRYERGYTDQYGKPKRKRGFLGEVFDIFD